jgi:putative acetyltransferase
VLKIVKGGLDNPQVVGLLQHHFDKCREVTPVGSAHVFDVSKLKQPDIQFWSAWDGETLMGVGALMQMNANDGEVKSMHTAEAARRTGAGTAILQHMMTEAKALGLKQLWLETGSFDYFAPARALYARHGFVECGPYEGYKPDPNSTFMTKKI